MQKTQKTSAEGTKCMFANCNRILSIYNQEPYCHSHLYQMSQEEKIWKSLHPESSEAMREKLDPASPRQAFEQ